jgi:hypothetical protein
MNLSQFAISGLSLVLLGSCSSSLSVSPNNPVPPIYEQGDPVLVSLKKHEVMVRLISHGFSSSIHDLPSFLVVFKNRGNLNLEISETNVTGLCGSKSVRVYSAEKLRKKIQTEAVMLAMSAALSGASQSIAASMPQQTYSSGSAYAYGSGGGYARANYSGVASTYNPAATNLAISQINANTANEVNAIASNRHSALADTSTMLQRNTLFPGRIAGGVVKLYGQDLSRGKPLKLVVTIDGEQHEFLFDIGK